MSSTRNKRKRPENDAAAIVPPSRRRSRDSRAANEVAAESKNEEAKGLSDEDSHGNSQTLKNEAQGKAQPLEATVEAEEKKPSMTEPTRADPGSSSSQTENSNPKQPLHVSEDKAEPSNTANANPDPSVTEKSSRIRELIAHRCVLLSRIHLCKTAAEKRLVEAKSHDKAIGTKDAKSGVSFKEMTLEEELAAFREMAKVATQSAKKSRSEGGDEKRTSLSLRRGSSVGKRMNAALSSLAPGTTGTGSSDGAAAQPQISAAPSQGKTLAKDQTGAAPPRVPSAQIPLPGHVPAALSVTPGAPPAKLKSTTQQSSKMPYNSVDVQKGRVSVAKTSNKTALNPVARTTPKAEMASAALLTGGSMSHLPHNRLAKPTVNFPEARSLRDRRELLQSKLKAMLDRRHREHLRAESSYEPNRLSQYERSRMSAPNGLEIASPQNLPRRRKTHWDRLLQEMSWLATDFIEERKWKMSAARTVSSTILTPGVTAQAAKPQQVATPAPPDQPTPPEVPGESGPSKTTEPQTDKITSGEHEVEDENKYVAPTVEDSKAARTVGRVVSCMISELSSATKEGGSMGSSDQYHTDALNRFNLVRSQLFGETASAHSKDEAEKQATSTEETAASDNAVEMDVDESAKEPSLDNSEQACFDRISKRTESLPRVNGKSKTKASWKDIASSLVDERLNLAEQQKESIDFVDRLWNEKPSVGAILVGPPVSGKTVAVCSLLWRNRAMGPQLVICPPSSVIRWKLEVSRYSSFRPLVFGLGSGLGSTNAGSKGSIVPGACDVLLCEFDGVSRLQDYLKRSGIQLFSIAVDCRQSTAQVRPSHSDAQRTGGTDFAGAGDSELTKVSWWNVVLSLQSTEGAKRLLIGHSDGEEVVDSKMSGGGKRQLEILSSRFTFVVGKDAFLPSALPLQRTVISWARKKGKSSGTGKVERVRRILQETMGPLSFRMSKPLAPDTSIGADVRLCSMSSGQRDEYEKCCSEVRGALSLFLADTNSANALGDNTFGAVSSSLFKLRYKCFHSGPLAMLNSGCVRERLGVHPLVSDPDSETCSFWRKTKDNASQPDSFLADKLMKGSAKLSELVSILKLECGFMVEPEDDNTRATKPQKERRRTRHKLDTKGRKKVAILTTLPAMQLLISMLLNSLGIQHEVVYNNAMLSLQSIRDDSRHTNSGDTKLRQVRAIEWAESQVSLSAFNAGDTTRQKMGMLLAPDIVVASPTSLGTWHGGIGIERADVVISLDEDWSGRGDFAFASSVTRWSVRQALDGEKCRVIRLLSKTTIEEKLFGDLAFDGTSTSIGWPCDSYGSLVVPPQASFVRSRTDGASTTSSSQFPGLLLLKLRDTMLDDVLQCSKPLPPLFGSGFSIRFLPTHTTRDSVNAEKIGEYHFVEALVQYESWAAATSVFDETNAWPSIADFCAEGLQLPLPQSSVVSRGDLLSLSLRYFLEKQCLTLLWTPVSGNGAVALSKIPLSAGSRRPEAMISAAPSQGNLEMDLVDTWHTNELGFKPDDMAASLLSYHVKLKKDSLVSTSGANGMSPMLTMRGSDSHGRCNAYAELYSSSWSENIVRDGSQGCEPIVYLPPLLPVSEPVSDSRTKLNARQGDGTVQPLPQSTHLGTIPPTDGAPVAKRKEVDDPSNQSALNTKRQRLESQGPPASRLAQTAFSEQPPAASSEANVEKAGRKGLANIGHTAAGIITEDEASSGSVLSTDEDFGLLGAGLVTTGSDFNSFASTASVNVGHNNRTSSGYRQDFLAFRNPCDAEESSSFLHGLDDDNLHAMMLFVKKRARVPPQLADPHMQPHRPPQGIIQTERQWIGGQVPPPTSVVSSSAFKDMNGDEGGKKMKKKSLSQPESIVPAPAFTRPGTEAPSVRHPSSAAISIQYANGKDGHRRRFHASFVSRHFNTGLSMFESIPFRVASLQVQRRVSHRVDRLLWKSATLYEAGPGLPLHAQHSHFGMGRGHSGRISLVEPLKQSSSVGDAAKVMSTSQRSALRRSLVSPCRVDFGPFGSGYMASPSGMTGISPPRSRLGVSLPMGVKVPQAPGEQPQPLWTPADDRLLQDSAVRFGMNWILVARALSGFEGFVVGKKVGTKLEHRRQPLTRSARQCRDRWQALARGQPSLANEVRRSEKILRDSALLRSGKIPGRSTQTVRQGLGDHGRDSNVVAILSSPSMFAEQPESTPIPAIDAMKADVPRKGDTAQKGGKEESTKPTEQGKEQDSSMTVPSRSFKALAVAKTKRQYFPITIPGVVGGTQPSQPVPSHPSHMQSVQASVAAKWSSGRTEMWPLQILDYADKNRAPPRQATTRPRPAEGSSSSTSASSTNRRQAPPPSVSSSRSPSSRPQSAGRERPSSFPPVPASTTRTISHNRSPPSGVSPNRGQVPPEPSAQAYVPPKPAANAGDKPKPGHEKP